MNTSVGKIMKDNLVGIIVGPLVKMVEAVFDLLIPLFMKAIIDLVSGTSRDGITQGIGNFIQLFGTWIPDNEKLNYAIVGGVLILIMGVLGFITTMITQYIAADTATKCGKQLRDAIYSKVLTLSRQDLEQFSQEKILTILNSDSYQVQDGINRLIRLGTRAPFIILGSLVISLFLDWQIGLVFLTIIPIILIVVFVIMRKASAEYLVIQTKLDGLSLSTSDNLEGARPVRAFNRIDYEKDRFSMKTEDYQQKSLHVAKLNALVNPLTFAIVTLATIAVVLIGSFQMNNAITINGFSVLPSTIITLVSYLDQIFVTLVLLTNLVTIWTKAIVSGKRCNALLRTDPSIKEEEGAITKSVQVGEEILDFDHVCLTYKKGGNNALEDIDFTLNKGESLGIIGGTGSGKSTLIKLVERFMDVTQGKLLYKGVDIKDYSLTSLRNEIGLVPQKSTLFKGTIGSNMKMADPNKISDDTVIDCLKDSMAYEFVSKYDDLLDHEVEEGGRNFSGGQRQRLCIARALVKNPEVLILDDSTSALDLLTDKTVRSNIQKHFPTTTKIIISQRVSTIQDCDKIIVLEGGKMIGYGTHQQLLSSCPEYLETYESQVMKGGKR